MDAFEHGHSDEDVAKAYAKAALLAMEAIGLLRWVSGAPMPDNGSDYMALFSRMLDSFRLRANPEEYMRRRKEDAHSIPVSPNLD